MFFLILHPAFRELKKPALADDIIVTVFLSNSVNFADVKHSMARILKGI